VNLRVIGIGSRRGDDAAGLLVAVRLRRWRLPGTPEILIRECPGLGLLEDLDGVDGAVLVDAMRGGGAPGAVRTVEGDALALGGRLSSHAIGVGASLALAQALGRPLPVLRLVGVEAAEPTGWELSAQVRGALPEACAAVRRALAEVVRAIGSGGDAGRSVGERRASSDPGELL
jgi:hydrogenase maturation protease